jgi:hypothetical protein
MKDTGNNIPLMEIVQPESSQWRKWTASFFLKTPANSCTCPADGGK